jgi:Mg-chelatase subunit ChlD
MFGFGKKKAEKNIEVGALTDAEMGMLDFIVIVDNSGSMGARSQHVQGNRLDEVEQDVVKMASIAEKHDDDGLTVICFDSQATVFDGVGSLKVGDTFKRFPPKGTTNLTAALSAAVQKAVESKKEVVALVYTDGRPNSERDAMAVIDKAGRTLGRPKIGFTFIQVGDDKGAEQFLSKLDDEMEVDVVATVPATQAKHYTLHQLAWLARNA